MTPFFSKRLLINLAVAAAAVGANAFVAYTQICGQRAADARTMRSVSIKQGLDAWRETLDGGLAALARFEASGAVEASTAAAARAAELSRLETSLRAEFDGEPGRGAALDRLAPAAHTLQRGVEAALARTARRSKPRSGCCSCSSRRLPAARC